MTGAPELYDSDTKPSQAEQRTLAFERSMYASAIRQLILQVRQTAHAWVTTQPETIRTADVANALHFLCSPVPLPEDLRDDLWQRIVGGHYVRFENDGHPEDAQAAADVARAVVEPELERLRAELARARNRVTALHAPVQHMGQTWCSECSARRSTGPKTAEWVALIPHPCPTIDAFSEQAPDTEITDGH